VSHKDAEAAVEEMLASAKSDWLDGKSEDKDRNFYTIYKFDIYIN
jgi:hypothetical protein